MRFFFFFFPYSREKKTQNYNTVIAISIIIRVIATSSYRVVRKRKNKRENIIFGKCKKMASFGFSIVEEKTPNDNGNWIVKQIN